MLSWGTSAKSANQAAGSVAASVLGSTTTTSYSAPAASAGDTASTSPPSTTSTIEASAPPKRTAAGDWKFEPKTATGVLPAAGPEVGVMPVAWGGGAAKHAENSDVLPEGSVAVAVIQGPSAGPLMMAAKATLPPPSVIASTAPSGRWPWPLPDASQTSDAKSSMRNESDARLLSVPSISVEVGDSATAVRTGKFWSRFAPTSGSPASFGVTPAGPRSMPSAPL